MTKKSVQDYIAKHPDWNRELIVLREIITSLGLKEHIKWSMPVYSHHNKNVVGFGATKNYVGIWFFQGGLLEDKHQKLMNAQEGKTQAMRQWRFEEVNEIEKDRELILSYIQESISNFESGIQIKPKKKKSLNLPPEMKSLLNSNQQIHTAFRALSISKQREYAEYISEAKRESTKENRLKKIQLLILEGKGLNDKYRK